MAKAHNSTDFKQLVKIMLRKMGLELLESRLHYGTDKPDVVAIYLDKRKYYIIEVVSEECLGENSPRLNMHGLLEKYRTYCKELFHDNYNNAALLATVVCDLVSSVEAFPYKTLHGYKLNTMTMYAAIAIPNKYLEDLKYVLKYLNIEHGSLDVLEHFTLVLISKDDSAKLTEKRRFMKFLLDNK